MANPQDILSKYLSTGQVLARRYQLEHLLGGGAYGAIYLAHDLISHERVAIKALPPREENTSQTAFQRFQREMQIISTLTHTSIITLYDFGETEQGVPFMVMEYVEGRTLDTVTYQRPMTFEDGLDVLAQLLGALATAHDSGVIHRDLKPANIMLAGEEGRYICKVLDFGMAKILETMGDESVTRLTREGVAVGTPRYIAPEQARGLTVGPYTDVYAAGLLAYEIFTGAQAVKDSSIEGAVMAHVSPSPLPLPEMHVVPEQVQGIIRKMIQKAVPDRYPHARDALRDVERLQAHLRRKASGVPAEPVDSRGQPVRAAQALELDYERVEYFEQEQKLREQQNRPPRQWPQLHLFSPVKHPIQYVERALALPMVILGFMTLSTVLPYEGGLRALAAMLPMLLCSLLGWVLRGKGPFTVSRMLVLSAASSALFAHLWDIKRVTAELFINPVWFLEPFKDVPGVGLVAHPLKALAQEWATLLSGFF